MKQRGEEQRVVPIDEAKKEGSSKRTRQIIAEADKAIDDTRRLLDEIRERQKRRGTMTRHLTRADRERIRAEVRETMKQPRGEIAFPPSAVGFTMKPPKEPDPEKETEAASE